MKTIRRTLATPIQTASKSFSAVLLTGPRRSGKTTLLQTLFPKADYRLLEDPDIIARVRADPHGFLAELRLPAILDEIQNAPELIPYIRTLIDSHPQKKGQWFLTGSQEAPLMRNVSESMAGRVAVFSLLPFSLEETPKVSLLHGGFPEVVARPAIASTYFRSYIQTYLERDVRGVSAVSDLATFRRFLSLLATRVGTILNRTEFAAPLGVSVPTVSAWLSILEITGQILLIPPFYSNLGKRIIKSPRLHFVDSGLVCHFLGIETEKALKSSPFLGPVFEGFVASEIVKQQINAGKARALYFFRDQQGLEVDFVVPQGEKRAAFVEVKASATVYPQDAAPLQKLGKAAVGFDVSSFIVYRPTAAQSPFHAVAPGVRAVSLPEFLSREMA